MRWGLVLVAWLALTASASAESASGTLEVGGTLMLPAGTTLESSPAALFAGRDLDAMTLEGRAARVTVTVVEKRYVSAEVGPLRPSFATSVDRATWTVHDATLLLSASATGWIGLHPHGGALAEGPDAVTLATASSPALGNAEAAREDAGIDEAYYHAQVEGASILRSSSSWLYTGDATMKTWGPSVTLHARENSTTVETGQFEDPAAPGTLVRRWVHLRLEESTLAATDARAIVASHELNASWQGDLHLPRAVGWVESAAGRWEAADGPHRLQGGFRARIAPEAEHDTLVMSLQGDLQRTTLSPRGAATAAPFLVGAIALAVAGMGAGALVARRRRARRLLHADDYVRLADEAADADEYERASMLAAQARRLSPTSRRLALDHAYYLDQAGRGAESRRLLEDPILRDTPDAHLLRARLDAARDEASAAASLVRALELAPILILDVEGDPGLSLLLRRAEVARAIREARRKLE